MKKKSMREKKSNSRKREVPLSNEMVTMMEQQREQGQQQFGRITVSV